VGGFQPRALFALLSGHHKLCGIFIQRDQVHHLWRLSEYKFGTPSAMLVGDPRSVTKMISSYLTQLDREASLVSQRPPSYRCGVNPSRRQGTGVSRRGVPFQRSNGRLQSRSVRRWGFIVFALVLASSGT
jgi:hypothetical protein